LLNDFAYEESLPEASKRELDEKAEIFEAMTHPIRAQNVVLDLAEKEQTLRRIIMQKRGIIY
jgi:hypothetical protein